MDLHELWVVGDKASTSLGWSGDQCPICRTVQVFHFLESRGQKRRECAKCGIPVPVPGELRGRLYPNRKDAERSVQTLAGLDSQVRLKPPEEDRIGIIREAFTLLAPMVRQHALPAFDGPATRSLIVTLVGSALLLAAAAHWADKKFVLALVLVLPALGILNTLRLFLTAPHRYVRTRIGTWLALSLRTLKPTAAELERVLSEGQAGGEPIYRMVTPGMILRRYRI